MKYFEPLNYTENYRKEYLDSLYKFANELKPRKQESSSNTLGKIKNELGYPYNSNEDADIEAEKETLSKEDGYEIVRCRFTFFKTIKLTGLLFLINKNKPLVIVQHGLEGTPEVMSNVYPDRNSYNYNDVVRRFLSYGNNIFCPQLLLWSKEKYGIAYSREELNSILKSKNSSLVGLEAYLLEQIIKYFKNESFSPISQFGMSYGGYLTYFTSLIDETCKTYIANSFAMLNITWPENIFSFKFEDVINLAFDTKRFYIVYGVQDPLFDIKKTETLLKSKKDQSRIRPFTGEHEIYKNDEYFMNILK